MVSYYVRKYLCKTLKRRNHLLLNCKDLSMIGEYSITFYFNSIKPNDDCKLNKQKNSGENEDFPTHEYQSLEFLNLL